MYSTIIILIALFNISYSWVINDIHYRTLNGSEYFLDGDIDLTELSEEDIARLRFSLIFPGTKWCGPGDIADGYDDLGEAEKEDMCCRDHDYCSDTISAGETKHNLTNEAFYTRLSCDCDEKFRRCLTDVNTGTSRTIGIVYFNVIGTKCFREDYPVTGCVTKGGWLNSKCIEYSYDTNGEIVYQWFDVPQFNKSIH